MQLDGVGIPRSPPDQPVRNGLPYADECPELKDLSKESQTTLDAYGAKVGGAGFANNCLLARRMVERGVRFVQLFDQDGIIIVECSADFPANANRWINQLPL